MKNWLRRIRGVGLMGLAWSVVWAPIAVLTGTLIVDPNNSMDELWVAVGAYPGFLCGALFSAGVWIADDRRRLDELSLFQVGAWGAGVGMLVGLFPLILGTPTTQHPLWLWAAMIIFPISLLSAISAIVSALLARIATNQVLPGSDTA